MKVEARQAKVDLEKISSRRRHAEQELARVLEACAIESSRIEAEVTDMKAVHDNNEKAANESEKRAHAIRQKVQMLYTEQQNLKQSVEDLRRQSTDLEKSLQSRRQEAEGKYAYVYTLLSNFASLAHHFRQTEFTPHRHNYSPSCGPRNKQRPWPRKNEPSLRL
jgi:septal ring factor EnvC (AmiA/AmiB activator)